MNMLLKQETQKSSNDTEIPHGGDTVAVPKRLMFIFCKLVSGCCWKTERAVGCFC